MAFFRSLLAFALAVHAAACSPPSARGTAPVVQGDTIFRYVTIGPEVSVFLGAPLPPASRPYLEEVSPSIFAVRARHFSGAAQIAFHVGPDARVTAVGFTYPAGDEGYDAKVASYAETLGVPARSGVAGQRSAAWQDSRTRFEIKEDGRSVTALLMDLASVTEPSVSD